MSNDHKLNKGKDIYRNVKNDWKVRITNKQRATSLMNKEKNQ